MIELNIEYTYKEICESLGWSYQPSNNKTKQKQIKCIEESFEFYHPINPKTKKEKKSYIFTKQIKEPILEDNRKKNGGARNAAGRKALLPEEEFDFLWRAMVAKAYDFNCYFEREWLNKVYFSNTLLFQEFGFSYGDYIDKAQFEEDDKLVRYIFSDIVYEALKSNTVTRLCRRYNLPKNSLPKGILRSRSKQRESQKISDDKLLSTWNEFERTHLQRLNCKSVIDAVRKGKYNELIDSIQGDFARKRKYNVQKYNFIQVTDFDVSENGKEFGWMSVEQYNMLAKCQAHFREIIFASVEKSCLRRIEENQKYKVNLNKTQKELLKNYLCNMIGKNIEIAVVDNMSDEEVNINETDNYYTADDMAWLELI